MRAHRLSESVAAGVSAADYRLFIERIAEYGAFLLDPDGRVLTWNAGAERLHGYTPEEIIGRPFRCSIRRTTSRRASPSAT